MPPDHLIVCRPFLLLPSIFPRIVVFPMSWLFVSGGQSIGASALVLPMNIQGWFPLGLTGLISSLSGDSQEFFPTPQFKSINSSVISLLYHPTFTSKQDYWKNHRFDSKILSKVVSLLFNMLSRFVTPSKKQLSSNFMAVVILELKKRKSVTASTFSWDRMPWS